MTGSAPLPPPDDPTARVLAIPGVAALFPVHVVAHVRERIAVAATGAESVGRIGVTRTSGVTRLRARIAADAATSAPDTGRAVATALLEGADSPDTTVVVQIAAIG